jgi:hypothetical protein
MMLHSNMLASLAITHGVLTNTTQLLRRLVQEISKTAVPIVAQNVTWEPYPDNNPKSPGKLTQDFLWAVSFRTNCRLIYNNNDHYHTDPRSIFQTW